MAKETVENLIQESRRLYMVELYLMRAQFLNLMAYVAATTNDGQVAKDLNQRNRDYTARNRELADAYRSEFGKEIA